MTGSYDTPERERSSAGLSRRKFLKYAGGIAGIGVLGMTSGFGLSGMVKDPKPADVSGRLQKLTGVSRCGVDPRRIAGVARVAAHLAAVQVDDAAAVVVEEIRGCARLP